MLLFTTWKDFFYNDYMVELFGGFIFSMFTLLIIWLLRPKMGISPNIAKKSIEDYLRPKTLTYPGKYVYSIKVMNNSRLFKVLDLKFELCLLSPESTPKGTNYTIKRIGLKSSHMWSLDSKPKWITKDSKANYAMRVTVDHNEDIEELLKNNPHAYLELKVIAKNNFSGITSITVEPFSHTSSIIKGEFYYGNNMEIKKC